MKTKLALIRIGMSIALAMGLFFLSGCAQFMVTQQPPPFKPTASIVGANRIIVAGELGSPVYSEEQNGCLIDTYRYVDGGSKNSAGMKTGRFILYCAGDVFTVFFDQLLTWPAEAYGFAGTPHMVIIQYNKGGDGFWYAKNITNVEQIGGRWSEPSLIPKNSNSSSLVNQDNRDNPHRTPMALWTKE